MATMLMERPTHSRVTDQPSLPTVEALLRQIDHLGREIHQLREALKSRTTIGKAIGLLMGQDALTADEAFDKLVKISQEANVKLRDIADRFVDAWDQNHNAERRRKQHGGGAQ